MNEIRVQFKIRMRTVTHQRVWKILDDRKQTGSVITKRKGTERVTSQHMNMRRKPGQQTQKARRGSLNSQNRQLICICTSRWRWQLKHMCLHSLQKHHKIEDKGVFKTKSINQQGQRKQGRKESEVKKCEKLDCRWMCGNWFKRTMKPEH